VVLGAGVDYVINPLLTARFEYLFICLGVATEYSVNNVEFMGNFWRVGVNYNFGTFAVRGAEEADRDFLKGAPGDYSWSGFYLGAVSGGSAGQRSTKYSVAGTPVAVSFTNTNGGFRNIGYHGLAGAQAGLNWQTGHLVTGFETDFQFTQIVGHTLNSRVNVTAGGVTGTLDSVVDMPLLGTFRGRVGWAANRWLYYVTGGFAYGEVETTSTLSVPVVGSVTSNSESTPIGWAAGFGFNTALWDRWDAKLEMTWVNLAAHKDTFAGIGPIGSITASSTIGDFVWRGALNTRFNPSSSSRARGFAKRRQHAGSRLQRQRRSAYSAFMPVSYASAAI
jgi:outer membrane immunogenic protein